MTSSSKFNVEVYRYNDGSEDDLLINYPIPAANDTDWIRFKKQVGLGKAGEQLYVKFTCQTTDGTSDKLRLNNVMLGTQSSNVGGVITEWEDYTSELTLPSNPTCSFAYAFKRRVGSNHRM